MKVKIYGERNCGTNYLEKLIESNLKVELLKFRMNKVSLFLLKSIKYDIIQDILYRLQHKSTLGWKHGCAPINAINRYKSSPLVVVTITKNPYSFLNSLYKRPYHIKGKKPDNLEQLINQNWITRGRDLCSKRMLNTPIELWNEKNSSYLNLGSQTDKVVINLTYEELVSNPEKCISKIAKEAKIPWKNGLNHSFINYDQSTKYSSTTYDKYKEYYENEDWKKEFKGVNIDRLNSNIDESVLNHFQYQKIK